MAKILWLADRLRYAGLTVKETTGWEDRGRPASTGGFAPEGVLMHHTAARASNTNPHPSLQLVKEGTSSLPGPLCHVLIDWKGVCWVIAAGRANHAGSASASGPMPAGDGNEMYVGIEVEYAADLDPNNPQYRSDIQYSNSIVAAAVLVSKLGHGRNYVRAHKETAIPAGRKHDPWPWNMGNFRDSVKQTLDRTGW